MSPLAAPQSSSNAACDLAMEASCLRCELVGRLTAVLAEDRKEVVSLLLGRGYDSWRAVRSARRTLSPWTSRERPKRTSADCSIRDGAATSPVAA